MSRWKLTVEIELTAPGEDEACDLPFAVWEAGDPGDLTDASLWVRDVRQLPDAKGAE